MHSSPSGGTFVLARVGGIRISKTMNTGLDLATSQHLIRADGRKVLYLDGLKSE